MFGRIPGGSWTDFLTDSSPQNRGLDGFDGLFTKKLHNARTRAHMEEVLKKGPLSVNSAGASENIDENRWRIPIFGRIPFGASFTRTDLTAFQTLGTLLEVASSR